MTGSKVQIRHARVTEVERIYGLFVTAEALCYIGFVDDEPIGCGGLTWVDGKCWMFYQTDENGRRFPFVIRSMVRKLKKMAVALGETDLYAARDDSFSTSARLCSLMGFEKTEEVMDGKEVWHVGI